MCLYAYLHRYTQIRDRGAQCASPPRPNRVNMYLFLLAIEHFVVGLGRWYSFLLFKSDDLLFRKPNINFLSSLSTWGNKDFPRPKANIAMMTKVRGAKRERWDKMSFPSDWFSYSSNYVAAIWPWLQLWVAFHDMYTRGLGELWCFLETKLRRRCQKIWKSLFFFNTFKSILWKFLRPEFGHNFKENIFKPFPGIQKRKGASLGSGTNRVSYLPTNYILFPALNNFLQLSTNLTYLMPIDLILNSRQYV